jgi:hypothetical protein
VTRAGLTTLVEEDHHWTLCGNCCPRHLGQASSHSPGWSTDNAPVNTQLYNLTGKAVLPVSFNPVSLIFAAQNVGTTSGLKSVKLTNNQAAALTLTSLVASGQYTVGAGTCVGTVNQHSSCTFTVTFSPTQVGTIPGVVTLTHDASGNPQAIKLSGTGQ